MILVSKDHMFTGAGRNERELCSEIELGPRSKQTFVSVVQTVQLKRSLCVLRSTQNTQIHRVGRT
jgi:hypothetical protein